MTDPRMTPTNDAPVTVDDLTRPIIGIENRTAREAFDIMADRIRTRLAALASAPAGDGVEALAKAASLAVADAAYHLKKYRPHVLSALEEALAIHDDAALARPHSAVAPAGDEVEDEYTYDELWQAIADATRIEGGVIAISVRTFRESIRATDSAAALARPRAAVGEREVDRIARDAAASVRPNSPWANAVRDGRRDDDDAVLAAKAAILALQFPPATVEG